MKSADRIEDRVLAKKIMKVADDLERLNDNVGNTKIRHKISEYTVRIRLLARDGHERNLNSLSSAREAE